ncbi:MAG: 50S ribosomal protein L17 [Candidatus Marinimicrobia bacterium]|nr:50S ribosomal protein L17 [Candidatus Neomarinimicrobiota bacterium]MAV96209.1 50S ribosomal protein L17 [Candidatus Neomarinimicrobiota bacterium]|tara:strand:+ start:1033 stop:1422 length:390 start_codon:yes stop_codon:yes gene_type:complete
MRHRKSGRKLSRKTAHRKALMSNLASALITHKKIKTTDAKAKELRMFIEPLITYAKRGDLHARRQVLKRIRHKSIVRELFDNIGPVFSNRDGGYTRITKLGYRDNDCAPISMIEFVDMIVEVETQGEEK